MLDRKTRNIDASIELLEDRIKNKKIISFGMYFISIIVLVGLLIIMILIGTRIPDIFNSLTDSDTLILGTIVITSFLLFISILFIYSMDRADFLDLDKQMLELLVYLKQKEKKK